MQKQDNFLLEGHSSTSLHQKHKSAIWNRTPPHLHIKPSLYVCRRVQGSQIFKQNWIISIRSKSYCNSSDLGLCSPGGWGRWVGGGCLGWSTIVYMSSGMFRGRESSNGIKLSRLVQELLNFGVFGFLQLLGVGWMGWGVVGCAPHTCAHVHTCTHMYAHTCMHGKHGNFMQMATPIGGIPGNSLWCHTGIRAHVCMHMHVHVGGLHPLTTPHPHPPTTHPQGDPRNHSKFNSTWTNRDISILFEDLKSVETPTPMGGCIIWWVGGCLGGLMGGVRSNH